jgi:plastocyanin
MRFYGIALAASAVVLGACAGGDKGAGDTTAVAVDTSAPVTTTPAPAAPTPTGTASMAAITGTTHEVKMIGDAQGYRFDPANITVKAGDGIKFTTVNGTTSRSIRLPFQPTFRLSSMPTSRRRWDSSRAP